MQQLIQIKDKYSFGCHVFADKFWKMHIFNIPKTLQ
jgi:hypothetical protein